MKLNLSGLSTSYTVRKLREEDLPALLAFCRGNPKYYRHCPPTVSGESLRRDMVALPPRKTLEDKYYLGFKNLF